MAAGERYRPPVTEYSPRLVDVLIDERRFEVDIVGELGGGRIVAIEVKRRQRRA